MERINFVNYNKLFLMNTNSLIRIYLGQNDYLEQIAEQILFLDNRLLNNYLDRDLVEEFINKLSLERLWELSNKSKRFFIVRMAYEKIMEIIDDSVIKEQKKFVKRIK